MPDIDIGGILQFLMSAGAKVAYTVILAAIILLCASEIYKVWGDRSPVLAAFDFNKDGSAVAASGEAFTRRIEQQQRLLRSMFDGQGKSAGAPILTDDARIQFGGLDVAELKTSDLAELKIETQGINLTAILGRLRNWIRQPNEIRGRVDQVGDTYHVFAEWRELGEGRRGGSPRFYSEPHKDLRTASFEVATRLIWQDIIRRRDPPPLARSLVDHLSEDEFVDFMGAWSIYQSYSAARGRNEDLAKQKAKLDDAVHDIDELVKRNIPFPPIYNLAANLKLQATPLEEMDAKAREDIKGILTKYLSAMKGLKLADEDAEKKLAAITKGDEAAERIAAAVTATREVAAPAGQIAARQVALAGGSIGPANFYSAASACCVVSDAQGQRYILTADYVFPPDLLAKEPRAEVVSPAVVDGGTEKIGALDRIHRLPGTEAGIALIRLDDDVEAKNSIPEIGRIQRVAEMPAVGETVTLFGRSSELRRGKILDADMSAAQVQQWSKAQAMSGLVAVERISAPGDGGAPVLDADGNLVGMAYAGSAQMGLILPLAQLFADLKLELVAEQG